MSLPVFDESHLQPFKFYDGEHVTKAVLVKKTMYRQVSSFLKTQRKRVYEVCVALSNYGYPTLVTASQAGYTVWVDVRCKEHSCDGCPVSCSRP